MEKNVPFLRLAASEEVALLADIQLKAAIRFPDDVLPEPMRSAYTVSGEIMTEALEKGRLWVACGKENALLGYAVWRDMDGAAVLEQVDVLPQHGRRGIGSLLVRHIMEQAAGAGHLDLYLTTFKNVPWNAPFYLKLGFTIAEDDRLPQPVLKIIRQEREAIKNRIAMQRDLSDLILSV